MPWEQWWPRGWLPYRRGVCPTLSQGAVHWDGHGGSWGVHYRVLLVEREGDQLGDGAVVQVTEDHGPNRGRCDGMGIRGQSQGMRRNW